jgi:hypothetical protein
MTLPSGNTMHDAPLLNTDTVPCLAPYVFTRSCYAKNAIKEPGNENSPAFIGSDAFDCSLHK